MSFWNLHLNFYFIIYLEVFISKILFVRFIMKSVQMYLRFKCIIIYFLWFTMDPESRSLTMFSSKKTPRTSSNWRTNWGKATMRLCTRRFISLRSSLWPSRSCPSKAITPTLTARSISSRSVRTKTLWSTTALMWNKTSFGWSCSSANSDQHLTSCKNKNNHSSNFLIKWKLDRFYFRIYFKSFRIFTQEQKNPSGHQSR